MVVAVVAVDVFVVEGGDGGLTVGAVDDGGDGVCGSVSVVDVVAVAAAAGKEFLFDAATEGGIAMLGFVGDDDL